MIGRVLKSISLVVFMLVAGNAAAELNIAVLNMQRAVLESAEAQAALEALRTDLEDEQNAIRELEQEITELQERLVKDGQVMSDAERRELQNEIEDNQIDYRFRVNKFQKEVNDRQQRIFADAAPKLDAVLKDLIEVEGYDLIIQRENLLYANSRHDITAKVTEKLNEKR